MIHSQIFEKAQNLLSHILPNKILTKLAIIRGLILGKSYEELRFQRQGLHLWLNNKDKVLEYWMKYRNFDTVTHIVNINKDTNILDVGCGIATVMHFLPGNRTGIDPLGDEYKNLYKYPDDINIKTGHGEYLPFESNTMDLVICSNAIDHTENPEKTIKEISRILKPGGFLWITVETFESSKKRDAAHPHAITTNYLDDLFKSPSWSCKLSWESPWIGIYAYIKGATTFSHIEQGRLMEKTSI